MDAELEAWKAENGYMETSAIQEEIRAILSNPTAPSQETWDRYHKLRNWVNVPFPERFRQLNKSRPFVDEAFADELKNTVFQRKVKSMPPEVQKMILARTLKAKLREFKEKAIRDEKAYMDLSPDEKRIPAFFEAAMEGVEQMYPDTARETNSRYNHMFSIFIEDIIQAAPRSIRGNKRLMLHAARLENSNALRFVQGNLKTDLDIVSADLLNSNDYRYELFESARSLCDDFFMDPELLARLFNRVSKDLADPNRHMAKLLELVLGNAEKRKINFLLEHKVFILRFMSALQIDDTNFYKKYYDQLNGQFMENRASIGRGVPFHIGRGTSMAQDPEIIAAFRDKGLDI